MAALHTQEPAPRHLRVFLASPGDVAEERKLALSILQHLPRDPLLRGKITLEAVAWEQDGGVPLSAWVSPQDAVKKHLPLPCQCHIVIVILWSRMGTPLPMEEGVKPDGSPYWSGTEWEYLNAKYGETTGGKPELLVYRRTEEPKLSPKDPEIMDKLGQWQKVEAFVASIKPGGINDYANPEDFKDKLANQLKFTINAWLTGASDIARQNPRAKQNPPSPDHSATLRQYLGFVEDKHQYLNFKGLGIADRVPLKLPLLDLYVPLKARLELPPGEKADERRWTLAGRGNNVETPDAHGLRLGEPQPVLDLLRQQDGLVILGDPGAGKTTFLKYLALQMARVSGAAIGLGERLPLLVPLSGYANELERGDLRLDDYIAGHFLKSGGDWPLKELLADALGRGAGLVLLDGLDEVADLALRHLVVERVVDYYLAHRQGGNKFVITSRIIGYREVRPAAPGLAECTLVDFNEEEIAEFVGRWTLALETQAQGGGKLAVEDAQRERTGLLDAVRHNPGVRQLAANPLLLTILALMKRQGVSLPERRVELYETYVKTLLSSWNRVRGLGRPPSRDLDPVQTVKVLAPLALWMHEVNPGVGLVKREDLRRELEKLYRERGEADAETCARRFLADVRHHSGLLLERGPDEYGFIHLTFEEYLAAAAIALRHQGDAAAIAKELAGHVGEAPWHEIIRLTVGYVGLVQQMDRVAGGIVQALAAEQPGPPGEAVVLAGEAVVDACEAGVDADNRARVRDALVVTMRGTEIPGKLRRRAGWLLGRLGWQPEGLDQFVEVPPGKFLYGDDRQVREIPYRNWIAQFPVTNRQFARFVEAGGYRKREFWTLTGWRWLEKNNIRQPAYWEDSELNNPIFPVVGVSWHEAVAYARWLDGVLAGQSLMVAGKRMDKPQGHFVRLPAEQEWERAARGVDGREYPWEGGFVPAYANIADEDWNSVTGGTTAVCAYPQGVSPTGAWDMAGNAWEWCLQKYSQPEDSDLEGDDSRVLRGGSWLDLPHLARCASRGSGVPGPRSGSVGFRLVCASPIAGL